MIPSAIVRLIKSKKKQAEITDDKIIEVIDQICEDIKDDVIDSYAIEIRNKDTSRDLKTVNQQARKYVNELWNEKKWNLASGKHIVSKLFTWISEQYKVSFNKFSLAREIHLSEIDAEVIKVITCIENKNDF